MREAFWRRAALAAACVIPVWYAARLAYVANPAYLVRSLPLFGADGAPAPGEVAVRLGTAALALAVLGAAGLWCGRPFLRWLRMPSRGAGRRIPGGWLVLAAGLLGLGLAGLWFRPVLAAAALGPALLGARGLPRVLRPGRAGRQRPWWRVPLVLAPAILSAWTVWIVLAAPEVFEDASRYHLFIPRTFADAHRIVSYERYFFWSYMGPVHMLYGLGLALSGELAAKCANLACALAALAVLIRISRRVGLSGTDGGLAAALAFTAPGFLLVTGSAFVEHGGALYALLAAEVLLGPGPRARRLREAGAWLGGAFSVKYTAAFGAAGCAAMLLEREWRAGWPRALRAAWGAAAVLAAAGTAPWAAWRWLATRDPISPVLARLGADTVDAASRHALDSHYAFAAKSWSRWIAEPLDLAAYPFFLAGVEDGFWEHPGPALPAMALALVMGFHRLSRGGRRIAWFTAGSFAAWFAACGGVSPHYVAGLAGAWAAAAVAGLEWLQGGGRSAARAVLQCCVFAQALASLGAATKVWESPRDAAFGVESRDRYLSRKLPPHQIHHPVRMEIERRWPDRGVVYVLGEDHSYDLSGRQQVDYERGADPLLWRLAAAADTPERLRVKARQRGWTHVLYSSSWPDLLGMRGEGAFRHDARTLRVVQEFWRRYASPRLAAERPAGPVHLGTYVFELRRTPRSGPYLAGFSRRRPFLPGASFVTLAGDLALEEGDIAGARAAYRGWHRRLPDCAVLHDRLARVEAALGNAAAAAAHRRRMAELGWSLAPAPVARLPAE